MKSQKQLIQLLQNELALLSKCNQICPKTMELRQLGCHCYTCAKTESTTQCLQCFLKSNHDNHLTYINCDIQGQCDCGDFRILQQCCQIHQYQKSFDVTFDQYNKIVNIYQKLEISTEFNKILMKNSQLLRIYVLFLFEIEFDQKYMQDVQKLKNHKISKSKRLNFLLFKEKMTKSEIQLLRDVIPADDLYRKYICEQILDLEQYIMLKNDSQSGILQAIMTNDFFVVNGDFFNRLTEAYVNIYEKYSNADIMIKQCSIFNYLKFFNIFEVAQEVILHQPESLINMMKLQQILFKKFKINIDVPISNFIKFHEDDDETYELIFIHQCSQLIHHHIKIICSEQNYSSLILSLKKLLQWQSNNEIIREKGDYFIFNNLIPSYLLKIMIETYQSDECQRELNQISKQYIPKIISNFHQNQMLLESIIQGEINVQNVKDLQGRIYQWFGIIDFQYWRAMELSIIRFFSEYLDYHSILSIKSKSTQINIIHNYLFSPSIENNFNELIIANLQNINELVDQLSNITSSYLFEMDKFIKLAQTLLKNERINQYENSIFKLQKLCYLEPTLWTIDRDDKYLEYMNRLQQMSRLFTILQIHDPIQNFIFTNIDWFNELFDNINEYKVATQMNLIRIMNQVQIQNKTPIKNQIVSSFYVCSKNKDIEVKQTMKMKLLQIKSNMNQQEQKLLNLDSIADSFTIVLQSSLIHNNRNCEICQNQIQNFAVFPAYNYQSVFKNEQVVFQFNCIHKFHLECVINEPCCPICRQPINAFLTDHFTDEFAGIDEQLNPLQKSTNFLIFQLQNLQQIFLYCKNKFNNHLRSYTKQMLILVKMITMIDLEKQPTLDGVVILEQIVEMAFHKIDFDIGFQNIIQIIDKNQEIIKNSRYFIDFEWPQKQLDILQLIEGEYYQIDQQICLICKKQIKGLEYCKNCNSNCFKLMMENNMICHKPEFIYTLPYRNIFGQFQPNFLGFQQALDIEYYDSFIVQIFSGQVCQFVHEEQITAMMKQFETNKYIIKTLIQQERIHGELSYVTQLLNEQLHDDDFRIIEESYESEDYE